MDDYGNDVPGTVVVATFCELQQRARDERDLAGETSDTDWLLIFPRGTALDTGDVVTVGGEVYELEGDPWYAINPRTGVESHVEASARRTGGADDEADA